MKRRTILKAGAALAASAALGVRAQDKPTLRFAAVFSDKDIRADMIRMLAKDVAADFKLEPAIEDDVAVTADGRRNLTKKLPVKPEDVAALVR